MSEQSENKIRQHPAIGADDDEIHFLDPLIVLAAHKKFVLGFPIATAALALAGSFLVPPTYVGTASIMPPQQQNSTVAAMLGQLGGLAGMAGGIAGLKNPNDLYVGMLQSRTVADNMITRFKLQERYDEKTLDETRKELAKQSQISSGKVGLISIGVSDKDPKLAADMANAYVDELVKVATTLALTEASKRRLFFEQQLKAAKEQLVNAEVALRKTQETTGLLQLSGQVQGIIANTAQLKGTIAAKEVQLSAMRTFATNQNPELLRLQEEIRGLRVELEKLRKGQLSNEGDPMIPTAKIPEAGVEYVRNLREVKYAETMYEMLGKQYELAKIDEAKESSLIQQLDVAVPPQKKAKPSHFIYALGGLLGGGLFGLIWVFMRNAYLRSRESEGGNERWRALSTAWKRTSR